MKESIHHLCPLCGNKTEPFYRDEFFQCNVCSGISRSQKSLPNADLEKSRYEKHQINMNDQGYLGFVAPILKAVFADFTTEQEGLDFGCGQNSVISSVLGKNNFSVNQYDPFFVNHAEILQKRYDFIICCEVVEHFHRPEKEFTLLKKLLQEKGELLIMTHLYNSSVTFENWYYKNDFTHVFFYTWETFEWIKKRYDFSELVIKDRFIRLRN